MAVSYASVMEAGAASPPSSLRTLRLLKSHDRERKYGPSLEALARGGGVLLEHLFKNGPVAVPELPKASSSTSLGWG